MPYLRSFFWGIVAALGALILEALALLIFQIASPEISAEAFFSVTIPTILLVSFFEEFSKLIVIGKKIAGMFSREKLVEGALVFGAGFFLVEMVLMLSSQKPAAANILENLVLHIGTAVTIAFVISKLPRNKFSTWLIAMSLAWIFHFAFNYLAMSSNAYGGSLKIALLIILIGFGVFAFFNSSHQLASWKNLFYNEKVQD